LNPLDEMTREALFSREPRIDVAIKNARRLLRLVNQLLDFQKLAAGKKEWHLSPIDAADFARSCGEYFAPACKAQGVAFRVRAPEAPVVIRAEADALEKIVFNFLANALKYTPKGNYSDKVNLVYSSKNQLAAALNDFLPEHVARRGGVSLGAEVRRQMQFEHGVVEIPVRGISGELAGVHRDHDQLAGQVHPKFGVMRLRDLTAEQFQDRRRLLQAVDGMRRALDAAPVERMDVSYRRAGEVLTSRRLVDALDPSRESRAPGAAAPWSGRRRRSRSRRRARARHCR